MLVKHPVVEYVSVMPDLIGGMFECRPHTGTSARFLPSLPLHLHLIVPPSLPTCQLVSLNLSSGRSWTIIRSFRE